MTYRRVFGFTLLLAFVFCYTFDRCSSVARGDDPKPTPSVVPAVVPTPTATVVPKIVTPPGPPRTRLTPPGPT